MNDNKLIQSYVFYNNTAFFVSTINRDSSAFVIPVLRYAETLVWQWNEKTRKRGRLIGSYSDHENDIKEHQRICKSLIEHGIIK